MGWDSIFSVTDKLLERFLPKRTEALKNKLDRLENERDEILRKPQTVASGKRLVRVLRELSRCEKALKNRT